MRLRHWRADSADELHNIAEESSHAERRADEAERELMEWKKPNLCRTASARTSMA